MKFKCIFCDSGGEYIPYCKFFEHRCNTDVVDPKLPERQMEFAFYGGGISLVTFSFVAPATVGISSTMFAAVSSTTSSKVSR